MKEHHKKVVLFYLCLQNVKEKYDKMHKNNALFNQLMLILTKISDKIVSIKNNKVF